MKRLDAYQSDHTVIDIAGPAPYNRLVFCTFSGPGLADVGANRKTGRVTVHSSFTFPGFAEGNNPDPIFKHTTTGWIAGTGPGNTEMSNNGPDAWLWAIDKVHGAGFTNSGVFFVEFDMTGMMPVQFGAGEPIILNVFSYIMIQDPTPTGDPRHPRPRPLHGTR